MTVILQLKSNSRYIVVEDVTHFKMSRALFKLKLREGRLKTYYRRHVRLMRIVDGGLEEEE